MQTDTTKLTQPTQSKGLNRIYLLVSLGRSSVSCSRHADTDRVSAISVDDRAEADLVTEVIVAPIVVCACGVEIPEKLQIVQIN